MYDKCSTKTKGKIKVAPWGYLRGNMVISFFGHKDYYYNDAVKAAAYSFVRKVAKGQVSFFVGCYGGFDKMSYDLAVRFKKEVDSTAKIVFVTPGINCTFDQTIAANVNCLSFACLFLFLHASTKVSCVGL